MATERLIPSVERRLSAWVNLQERLGHQPRPRPRRTITLSRQFGCEGYPLAERLQAVMEARSGEPWTIFDKALLERVSGEKQLSDRLLGQIGAEGHALDVLASLMPGWHTHDEAYDTLVRYMVRIAREGNAIIVGRGGAVVTQELPNCTHFRLEAPREFRVASIACRLAVSEAEAEALVTEQQERRDRFIERFLHCSIADTRYYHAVYNSAKSPLDRIAASILELIPPSVPA
ncbi:MAG TPA: cytidylate kinase-like family protein [Candidatus Dormibacteraeota bacterium]|nr:cytidylate kinase-like family protein [Candidatus Dormibacteraeota bacterium]